MITSKKSGPGLLAALMGSEEWSAKLTEKERLDVALEYAVSVVSRWAKDGRIVVDDLDESAFKVSMLAQPIFQKKGYGPSPSTFVGYEFAPVEAEIWKKHYESNDTAARIIRDRLATNDIFDRPLPTGARVFRSALLNGQIREPVNKTKPTVEHRDTVILGIAKTVCDGLGYNQGANRKKLEEKPTPICGVTIAAAALSAFSIFVSPAQAGEVLRKKKKINLVTAQKRNVFMPKDWKDEGQRLPLKFPLGVADVASLKAEVDQARKYFE